MEVVVAAEEVVEAVVHVTLAQKSMERSQQDDRAGTAPTISAATTPAETDTKLLLRGQPPMCEAAATKPIACVLEFGVTATDHSQRDELRSWLHEEQARWTR